MKIYNYPEKQDWPAIIGRQKAGPSGQVKDTVSRILSDIRTGGDIKVLEYVKALDGFDTDIPGLSVSAAEIAGAVGENAGAEGALGAFFAGFYGVDAILNEGGKLFRQFKNFGLFPFCFERRARRAQAFERFPFPQNGLFVRVSYALSGSVAAAFSRSLLVAAAGRN